MTGWTWETVDSLTLPQVDELTAYWADFPPLHLMIRSYLGIESSGGKPSQSNESELRSLAAQFNSGG